jgi:hypothetical protein
MEYCQYHGIYFTPLLDKLLGCLWHSTHLTASPQMELVEQSKITQKHIPPFQVLKPICSLGLDQSTLQEQLLVLGFDSHRSKM